MHSLRELQTPNLVNLLHPCKGVEGAEDKNGVAEGDWEGDVVDGEYVGDPVDGAGEGDWEGDSVDGAGEGEYVGDPVDGAGEGDWEGDSVDGAGEGEYVGDEVDGATDGAVVRGSHNENCTGTPFWLTIVTLLLPSSLSIETLTLNLRGTESPGPLPDPPSR